MPDTLLTTKDYLDLSTEAYDNGLETSQQSTEGWNIIGQSQNDQTGYAAVAYQAPDGSIVIAHRGTDGLKDLGSDLSIGRQNLPAQFDDADNFTQEIMSEFGDEVVHTGHSLGGGLAQLVGHKYGTESIAFDPPGMVEVIENNSETFGNQPINTENFTSVIVKNSPVSSPNTQIFGNGTTKIDLNPGSTLINPRGHSISEIANVIGDDGEISEEYVLNQSTVTEGSIHQAVDGANAVVDSIGNSSVVSGVSGGVGMAQGIKNGIDVINDASLTEAEKVTQLEELFDGFKDDGADLFMGIFDNTFGEIPMVGDSLSSWADDKLRNFITSDEAGGLEDVSNNFGDWIGRQGANLLDKVGLKDDLENFIRKKMGKDSGDEEEMLESAPVIDDSDVSAGDVEHITRELEANMDLLFQNIEKYKSSVQGI